MLDDHTTPTAYLTRCIRERVERETVQFQVDSRLYRQFTELARSRNAEPEELLLDYIRRMVEEACGMTRTPGISTARPAGLPSCRRN